MTSIKTFKKKKKDFDTKITILKEFSDFSDIFYESLKELKEVEMKKSKIINKMIDFVLKFYNKDCIYFFFIKKVQRTFTVELEKIKTKLNFYKNIREFNKSMKEEFRPVVKLKNGIYKLLKQEFHYLNKLNDLKIQRKKLKKNNKSTKSIIKQIDRVF